MRLSRAIKHLAFVLLFAVALFQLAGGASALEMMPERFDEPLPAEFRTPIENFLKPLAGDKLEEALTSVRIGGFWRPDSRPREIVEGKLLIQIMSERFCRKPVEDGCLTIIGKMSGAVFESEMMFFAGDRMNMWDTVSENWFGIRWFPVRFFSKTMITTVILTSQGWMVVPSPQTDPPQ